MFCYTCCSFVCFVVFKVQFYMIISLLMTTILSRRNYFLNYLSLKLNTIQKVLYFLKNHFITFLDILASLKACSHNFESLLNLADTLDSNYMWFSLFHYISLHFKTKFASSSIKFHPALQWSLKAYFVFYTLP